MGNSQLQAEFSRANGNGKAWDYYTGSHGPHYSDTYVKWLEAEVVALRQQQRSVPFDPCDESKNYPEV